VLVPAILDSAGAHCSIDAKAIRTHRAWVGRTGKASGMSSAQFCQSCGHRLLPDVRFCTNCGNPAAAREGDDFTIPPRSAQDQWPGTPEPFEPPVPRARPVQQAQPVQRAQPVHRPQGRPPPPPRSRRPLLAVLIAVIVIGAGTGIALAAMHSHKPRSTAAGGIANHSSHTPAASTSPTSSPTSASSSAAAVPPRQQAAQALAGLLSQSGSDRAAVVGAVAAVQSCSGNLSQDEKVFRNSASSRQSLLAQLSDLPHRSLLPQAMLTDLTAGWQASVQADQDFVTWVQDEISQGCSMDSKADPAFAAATAPDTEATIDKKAFLRLWNPIAVSYSLPTYQYTEI
jgi:ribosomal protein L32